MKTQFSQEVINHILEQSLIYQCACPGQVCKSINEQRDLYAYQEGCLNLTDTDRAVHVRIADAVVLCHAEMERCLEAILLLEGWDMTTYEMPEGLKKQILQQFLE